MKSQKDIKRDRERYRVIDREGLRVRQTDKTNRQTKMREIEGLRDKETERMSQFYRERKKSW